MLKLTAAPLAALGVLTAWALLVTGAESVQLVRMCQANGGSVEECQLQAFGR
jgi:hypothetical protein